MNRLNRTGSYQGNGHMTGSNSHMIKESMNEHSGLGWGTMLCLHVRRRLTLQHSQRNVHFQDDEQDSNNITDDDDELILEGTYTVTVWGLL